ncbi:Y4yA family PLP-dependent enzyme [Euzebyella marina]|uniref:Y4yA family PLP-dependent enzyme n=1 Tax=Euzebyella marina TaxID=1761453 RepID=A0A3G2L5A3_9FLAO|nr:alanine racemase [Euzebyella marina]AYN67454.1 Y4yA family PLP-dependent enzyme [Euzebyella marina]
MIENISEIKNVYKAKSDTPLTPKMSEWMNNIMGSSEVLESLFEKYDSPINVHHLPSFRDNIKDFQDVFNRLELKGQIYFARKANKCTRLVKEALEFGIGVDTASYTELNQSLLLGGNPDKLVLTAAVKNRKLMQLAITNQVVMVIDNLDELQMANQIAGELNQKCNVAIRLSGFKVGGEKLYSRFGFDIERDIFSLKMWFSNNDFPNLMLRGIHFHLDGYSIRQRGEAAQQTLQIIKEFRQQGNVIEFMDIGGGILMNYLESENEWNAFQYNLRSSLYGNQKEITFRNDGLGLHLDEEAKTIRGNLRTYPYYNSVNGPEYLENVLQYKNSEGKSVADILKELNLEVRIEPGRSLLDQVGITMAKVIHRKIDANDNWLVGLEMNMSHLKSSSADYLVDPFLVYKNLPTEREEVQLYFTGAYCLEQDVLLKRALKFPGLPSQGDVVIFVNTAGYMMHFYETQSHLINLSTNIFTYQSEFQMTDEFQEDIEPEKK